MSYLISIDPGESSGWSTWHFDALTPLRHLDHGTVTGGLRGFLQFWDRFPTFDYVVVEDYILDGRTVKPNTTPLEIIGALEAFAYLGDWPLARQRNTQKAMAPDELLKRLDLWWPGKGHDRDSARHAIAWARTARHMPTLRWISPPPERKESA